MDSETEEVINWLRSPDGENWSHRRMGSTEQGNPARHSMGAFAAIKYDHEECTYDSRIGMFRDCRPAYNGCWWTDGLIMKEIQLYGMNGVPE